MTVIHPKYNLPPPPDVPPPPPPFDVYQNTNQFLLLTQPAPPRRHKPKDNMMLSYDQSGNILPLHYMPYNVLVSPQVVPNYINNTQYQGPRPGIEPRLATVRESSQEEEVPVPRDRNRSCDPSTSTNGQAASELDLDGNFDVILLSPSTPPPTYNQSVPENFV